MGFMSPFDYISILSSVVLALGITRILTGVGRIQQFRSRIGIDWVHLLWLAKATNRTTVV